MSGCLTCKYADWQKTASGRLHPSGDGRCTWKMPEIKIPASMYFGHYAMSRTPSIAGGYISRHRGVIHECPTYEEDAS